jgi:hypothetical protein
MHLSCSLESAATVLPIQSVDLRLRVRNEGAVRQDGILLRLSGSKDETNTVLTRGDRQERASVVVRTIEPADLTFV